MKDERKINLILFVNIQRESEYFWILFFKEICFIAEIRIIKIVLCGRIINQLPLRFAWYKILCV